MLGVFSSAANYLKAARKPINIDNVAFKFHYRLTFALLLVATILVTSRQYIGDHIRCLVSNDRIPVHVIETFCFFTSTFTVVRHLNETLVAKKHVPHPGIGPVHEDDSTIFHAYYQWVPFVLFAQSLMFYLPHYIWKKLEGGKIKHLVTGMHMIALSQYTSSKNDLEYGKTKVLGQDTLNLKIDQIKRAFYGHVKSNPGWGWKLILCELLNLANVILQVIITNKFLSERFFGLGLDFLHEDFLGEMDILDIVFPKMTKCHFYKYGPSGSLEIHDALCVMALNLMNEKIYVFLWFWYIVLFLVSVMALLWRFLTICCYSRSSKFNSFVYAVIDRKLNIWDSVIVKYHFTLSDWLFLYYIANNLEPFVFRRLVLQIGEKSNVSGSYKRNSYESGDEKSSSLDSLKRHEAIDEVDFGVGTQSTPPPKSALSSAP